MSPTDPERDFAISDLKIRVILLEKDAMMPKYMFHRPLDTYQGAADLIETHPPVFGASILSEGVELPVPPPDCRPGYSPEDDQRYLDWGRRDHDLILDVIRKHCDVRGEMAILDWGCSSGRVLRHFYEEAKSLGWRLHGTDIQAALIQWLRDNFPPEFDVTTATTLPHVPFRDASLDVLYGFSVFTHTKYLWDAWLAEFRRVLRPGGLCIQTVQSEHAWREYHENRKEQWVKDGHPASMLQQSEMNEPYFFYGDVGCSQTFFREDTIRQQWSRYFDVVDFFLPTEDGFQNMVVLRNRE